MSTYEMLKEEGRQEGIKEGIIEGLHKGEDNMAKRSIINLHKFVKEIDRISEMLDLLIEVVKEALKNKKME